jgi:hypothetical protein
MVATSWTTIGTFMFVSMKPPGGSDVEAFAEVMYYVVMLAGIGSASRQRQH